jgi:hypothetical protein
MQFIYKYLGSKPSWCIRFNHQHTVVNYYVPHACYVTCPSHYSTLHHSNNIWWREQFYRLISTQFSPAFCYFTSLNSNRFLQQPVSNPYHCVLLPKYQRPIFTRTRNYRQHYILYVLIRVNYTAGEKTNGSQVNSSKHNPKFHFS